MRETWRNLFICLLGGILFHYLFYGKGFGISYPIYIAFLYSLFFLMKTNKNKKATLFEICLFLSVILLAATYTIFTNDLFLILNFFIVPVLLFVHMTHAGRWNEKQWSNRLYVRAMLLTFSEMFIRFFTSFQFVARIVKGIDKGKLQTTKKVFIGFLISVPLLWTIMYLLMSSDEYFSQIVGALPNWLYATDFYSLLFQIILIGFVTLSLFAFFITLAKPLEMEETISETQVVKMDTIIASTVLILLNLLYFLYTAVQFAYFFSGDPSSATLDYTYAEYARRGFSELTIVSVINLGLLFFLTHVSHFRENRLPVFIKILLSILVLFTFVMLTSGFYRLSLYEQAYGYTYSRVFAHTFMILLFLMLILSLFKIYNAKFKLLRAMFMTSLVTYVIVNYFNIDQFIVNQNMKRYEETGILDIDYLSTLSYDAIPAIIGYDKEEFQPLIKNKEDELKLYVNDWQAFNYSHFRAERVIEKWKKEYGIEGEEK